MGNWAAGVLSWAETYSQNAQGERHVGDGYNIQGMLHIQGKQGVADKPGILKLDGNSAGNLTTYFLWVDNTGDLRIGTALPTNEDGEGTIVGAQS